MGGALLAGLLRSGWANVTELAVVEPDVRQREALVAAHPGLVVAELPEPEMVGTDGSAVLAVKPEAAEPACRVLAMAGVTRLLSVVAGLPAQRLEACFRADVSVVRAMPNTPALIGRGISAMAGGSHVRSSDLDWAESVLSSVGTVVRMPERLIDVATGLSGSGPAYVFLIAESLIEAGVLGGLPRDVSQALAVGTLQGASALLAESGESPEVLRAAVTSPGGATAAGLRALEARAVRSAFLEAVAAATERARQLGR